jgi:hypothetical protein
VLTIQAQLDEMYKNLPKSVVKKMDQAAKRAKEDEFTTEIEAEKHKGQCTIS